MSMKLHLAVTVFGTALLCAGVAGCARPSPAAELSWTARPRATQTPQEPDTCPAMTAAIVEQGKKIFSGQGNCYSCHGTNAKGTPLAPDLTDQKWLQIDGSFTAIVKLVQTGVPRPKEHPAPMLPMGGAKLSEAQVCAVGTYVFTLTHPSK